MGSSTCLTGNQGGETAFRKLRKVPISGHLRPDQNASSTGHLPLLKQKRVLKGLQGRGCGATHLPGGAQGICPPFSPGMPLVWKGTLRTGTLGNDCAPILHSCAGLHLDTSRIQNPAFFVLPTLFSHFCVLATSIV